MTKRIHIRDDGTTRRCRVTTGTCPYGKYGHHSSHRKARQAYESSVKSSYGFPKIKKSDGKSFSSLITDGQKRMKDRGWAPVRLRRIALNSVVATTFLLSAVSCVSAGSTTFIVDGNEVPTSTVTQTMETPSYKNGFYYLNNSKPARWDPCRAITYSVKTDHLADDQVDSAIVDVESTLAVISKHSGLEFAQVESDGNIEVDFDVPSVERAAGISTYETEKIGVRGIEYEELVSATVVVKPTLSQEWRQNVLLHEMMHAVGIGHSKGLMSALQKDGVLHEGDILGLQAVGANDGCFPSYFADK